MVELPPLGAHVSAAGGAAAAIARGVALGCTALQIFVKSPSQWRARPLAEADARAFREARAASPIGPVVAHAAYLINLAAAPGETLDRSRAALADELARGAALGLDALVLHPGAHLGAGVEAGLARVAASLDAVLAGVPEEAPRLLLEVTAGQGSVLGARLEELERIVALAACGERLGVCLDTCHLLAAGYPIDEEAGREALLAEVDRRLGLERLGAIHLNDSAGPRGARRDRHANIGEGRVGTDAFRSLLLDPRLRRVPMLLETPLGDDGQGHARDLATLRHLAGAG
ncbi:MAG TPA: deoxyribonuclease IV [Thermoanaerobaculia bacterium]|nr:deoxyribonuclease IV [Thermoanaerobaculia bacterium]